MSNWQTQWTVEVLYLAQGTKTPEGGTVKLIMGSNDHDGFSFKVRADDVEPQVDEIVFKLKRKRR